MRTLALALACSLFLLADVPLSAQAGLGSGGGNLGASPAPPVACTEVDKSILTQQVQQADVTDTINVTCHSGQAFFATTSGGSVAVGTSCTATWYANVQTSQIDSNGLRSATWQPPPGRLLSAGTTHTLLSIYDLNPGLLSGAQAGLYTNLVYATYEEHGGTWNGSSCTGGGWSQCGHTIRPEGLGSSMFDPCVNTTSYAPNPPDCTGACQQPVVDLIRSFNGHFVAGHVQTWPQPAPPPRVGAVVNLPVQYYIPDWSFNGTQQQLRRWAIVLIGPPDDLGRSRVFTYLVSVGIQGIDWDFGDGTGAHFSDATGFSQNVYPPNGTSTVNHPYTRISDPNPYHVTVTETWGIRVDEYWIGGHTEVTNLERTFPVIASSDLSVGQVEPIPCSGTGCA